MIILVTSSTEVRKYKRAIHRACERKWMVVTPGYTGMCAIRGTAPDAIFTTPGARMEIPMHKTYGFWNVLNQRAFRKPDFFWVDLK